MSARLSEAERDMLRADLKALVKAVDEDRVLRTLTVKQARRDGAVSVQLYVTVDEA